MPQCPNCNYELVLLEHRMKYKCAKCGKLFKQKEIEIKEFVEYNKKQRQEEKEKIEQEIRQSKEKPKLTKEEKLAKNRESQQKFREENRQEYNAQKREYWASNHEHLIVKRRENYHKKKAQILPQQALYRQNHKIERRINALRWEQKLLAVRMFENGLNKAYSQQFCSILPIFSLSYLLHFHNP